MAARRRVSGVARAASGLAAAYAQPLGCARAAVAVGCTRAARQCALRCMSGCAPTGGGGAPAAAAAPADGKPENSRDCWACGACVNKWNLFCGSCEYIQPLDGGTNYFQLLQIPQSFDLDVAMLEKSFKNLQKAVHPDLFGTRSPTEQALSAEVSSNINIAYRVLRGPITRAQYLLQLHGIDAIGEAASGAHAAASPALLLEVMEAREQLEDTSPAAAPAVAALLASTEARIGALLRECSRAFAGGALQAAAEATVALQYFSKLQAEAQEWMGRHGGQQLLQLRKTAAAAADANSSRAAAAAAACTNADVGHVHGPACAKPHAHSAHGHGHSHGTAQQPQQQQQQRLRDKGR